MVKTRYEKIVIAGILLSIAFLISFLCHAFSITSDSLFVGAYVLFGISGIALFIFGLTEL